MDEFGMLTVWLTTLLGSESHTRVKKIIVFKVHSCTRGMAVRVYQEWVKNNNERVNCVALEAKWQVAPERLVVEGSTLKVTWG